MPAEESEPRALVRRAAHTLPGDTPRLDAELLLAHVLGQERLAMLVSPRPLTGDAMGRFETLLARRRQHEPIAYILGRREFWSLELVVSPSVLIPRPDSETLIEAARQGLHDRPPATILDLGTGSGALLLAALSLWPGAFGVGIDRSGAALAVAGANASRLGFGQRAAFMQGDWADGIDGRFDLILCNPPYLEAGAVLMPDVAEHEPQDALFAGADGLDAYRLLLPALPRLLAPEGLALFEFGLGQEVALETMAADNGLQTDLHPDLAGRPRAIALRRPVAP